MPKLKPGTIFPTDEEDEKIRNAATSDPDTMLLENADMKLMSLEKVIKSRRGRPMADNPKTRITIRHSPEVVEAFKATGYGWQTRMDKVLKDWLKHHNPSDVKI